MTTFNIKTKQDANNAVLKMLCHQDNVIIRTADEVIRLVEAHMSKDLSNLWHTIEIQNLSTGLTSQEELTDTELTAQLFHSHGMCVQF